MQTKQENHFIIQYSKFEKAELDQLCSFCWLRKILVLFLLITIISIVTDTIDGLKYKISFQLSRCLYSSLDVLNKTGTEKVLRNHLFFQGILYKCILINGNRKITA